jgi:hypothetical protein
MSLRDWSARRVALLWLAWPTIIALAMFVPMAIIIWRPTPDAVRLRVLPPQWSDFTLSVSNYPVAILYLQGPPALLTGIWFWQRSRLR